MNLARAISSRTGEAEQPLQARRRAPGHPDACRSEVEDQLEHLVLLGQRGIGVDVVKGVLVQEVLADGLERLPGSAGLPGQGVDADQADDFLQLRFFLQEAHGFGRACSGQSRADVGAQPTVDACPRYSE